MFTTSEEAVQGFYDGIFRFYEKANVLLTLGRIKAWRRRAAAVALSARPARCADICCGTGEFSLLLKNLSPGISLTCVDFNEKMLEEARAKVPGAAFVLSSARKIPFGDGELDLATMAFAARNLESQGILQDVVAEIFRVLKPGGVFVNLETNVPENALVRPFFSAYLRIISASLFPFRPGVRQAYRYLCESAGTFGSVGILAPLLESAGFASVSAERMFFSLAAILKGTKPFPRS